MSKSENRQSGRREIPVKEVGEFSVGDDQLLRQRIAEKAYQLYECRGCCHGYDVEDWLEAERLLLAEITLDGKAKTKNRQNKLEKQKKGQVLASFSSGR